MTLAISTTHKEAVAAARIAAIDAGSGPGKIWLYPGARIDITDTPPTAIAVIVLPEPCGTVTATGVLMNSAATVQATHTGTVTWARVTNGDGVAQMDGDVRMTTDSDVAIADFIIDESMVYAGAFVTLGASELNEAG